MPIRPCPNCETQTARQMGDVSYAVWYYRCEACGHVWTIDKHDDSKVTHVTPLGATRKPTDRLAE